MNKDLGKILLSLLFSVSLFAGVNAKVSQTAVYQGESVELTITAEGKDATFPDIFKIDSFPVTGTSSAKSTRIDNGEFTRTISYTYTFSPTHDVIIPSYELTVDGKRELTKAIPVKVIRPTASSAGSDFTIELSLDKTEAYVGESVRLDIVFKRKLDAKADKIQINEPTLEGFWAQKAQDKRQGNEGEYLTETYTYLLFPQKEGDLKIPSIEAAIGTIQRSRSSGMFSDPFFDRFTNQIQWKKIFSNEATVHVRPLPQGVELYGSFSISAKVDKHSVKADKPVNLTITVSGEGNVEDIIKFDPDIDDVITYADDPKVEGKIINDKYVGTFKQKIAIIADKDFQIPSLRLRYFDKEKKSIVTKMSEPIDIKVTGSSSASSTPTIEKSQAIIDSETKRPPENTSSSKQTNDSEIKYLYLLIGLILGALGTYGSLRYLAKRPAKKEHDLLKAIEKTKDDKILFELLLPFGANDPLISQALEQLEENLYAKAKHTIDKATLIEWFEDHPELLR